VAVVEPGAIGPASLMGVDDAAETLLGCPAPVVSVVASMMAREVVRLLVSKHSPLSGRMLIIDLESISFETVSL
jgi:molybdopterin/thiamine biosynthesis adenylyltransferase